MCIYAHALLVVFAVSTSQLAWASGLSLQTRVAWLDYCQSEPKERIETDSDRAAPLVVGVLAVLAPKFIEGAIDAAAIALKAAGESKSVTSTARSSANFYNISQNADFNVSLEAINRQRCQSSPCPKAS